MVDINKRKTIKVMSGTAVIASVPSFVVANADLLDLGTNDLSPEPDTVIAVNDGTELSIAMSLESQPSLILTNNSDKTIVVKHIHPGIVHAGARAFDLNAIFKTKAQSLNAGESRSFMLETTASTQRETAFPKHLYRNKPQRVVAVRGMDSIGEVVNSSRSFYA